MATSPQPAQTDEISTIREHLARYRAVTLQSLEFVPDDKLVWQPAGGMMSFAEQFWHIAQTSVYFTPGLFDGRWDTTVLEKRGVVDRNGLTAALTTTRDLLDDNLKHLPLSRLEDIPRPPNVPVAWPLRGWLWFLLEHEIHHKAQIAVYLREIGIVPPFFAFVLPRGVRPDIG